MEHLLYVMKSCGYLKMTAGSLYCHVFVEITQIMKYSAEISFLGDSEVGIFFI